jgi:hypothetical protein
MSLLGRSAIHATSAVPSGSSTTAGRPPAGLTVLTCASAVAAIANIAHASVPIDRAVFMSYLL